MTWPWHTCSKDSAGVGSASALLRRAAGVAVLACSLLVMPVLAATVAGTVELTDSRDPAVRKHKDYSGVVLWLEPIQGASPAPAPRRAQMVQKGKSFVPHVLAIPVGIVVDFPNFDPIFHNAFSNFSGQIFDIGLYPPGTNRTVTFKRDGIVRVFCNIHPTMSAVIVVLRTPYFAVSKPSGEFAIPDVAPGEYRLRIFHERSSEERTRSLERRVMVDSAAVNLPTLSLSETGYLQMPHKNKYGKEYPPEIEDHVTYPGARK